MNRIEKGWLFKSLREKGWKPTWGQLKYNYLMLDTAEAQLKKQLLSHIITLIGLLVVCGYLIFTKRWWFLTASAGTALIFYYQMKGVWRQLKMMQNINKEMEKLMGAEQNEKRTGEQI